MPTRRLALASLALLLATVMAATRVEAPDVAPFEVLVVRVVEVGTGKPIPNADLFDRDQGVHRLTDARGEARLSVAPPGTAHLRVRQLGFQPVERDVVLDVATFAQPVVITMSRLVVLSSATTRASNACRGTADSLPNALSLLALEQLRFAAEQYARFSDTYPSRLSFEGRTAIFSPDGRPLTVLTRKEEHEERDWNGSYRAGRVVTGRGSRTSAFALSLATLADPVFWERHCLVARRVVTVDGRRVLPLEFLPALDLEGTDYGGTVWVDSATSVMRRVEFQVIGLDRRSALRRMEGYMTFTYPSPYIARPDSIVSLWWMHEPPEGQGWGTPSQLELLRVASVKYLHGEPPASPR